MRVWSFYDSATGLFSGRHTSCSSKLLSLNTPAGYVAIEGQYDRRTQRVELATGAVVSYERPAAEIEAEQRAARQQNARARIAMLELAQSRPLRELAIDPSNAAARKRLAEIEAEIESLRPILQR